MNNTQRNLDLVTIFAEWPAIAITHNYNGNSESLQGIFDNPGDMAVNDMIESSGPTITLKTADIGNITRGSNFTINSITYYIKRKYPDDNGITIYELSKTDS